MSLYCIAFIASSGLHWQDWLLPADKMTATNAAFAPVNMHICSKVACTAFDDQQLPTEATPFELVCMYELDVVCIAGVVPRLRQAAPCVWQCSCQVVVLQKKPLQLHKTAPCIWQRSCQQVPSQVQHSQLHQQFGPIKLASNLNVAGHTWNWNSIYPMAWTCKA